MLMYAKGTTTDAAMMITGHVPMSVINEEVARPILYHSVSGTCWHPYVKGYTMFVNAIYNGIRMEDVWLDR